MFLFASWLVVVCFQILLAAPVCCCHSGNCFRDGLTSSDVWKLLEGKNWECLFHEESGNSPRSETWGLGAWLPATTSSDLCLVHGKRRVGNGRNKCGKQMHGITSLHAKFLGSCSVFNVSDVDARWKWLHGIAWHTLHENMELQWWWWWQKCIGVSRHVIVLKRLATTCLWHTMHGTKNMEDNWIEVGRMTQHDTASHTLGLSCLKAHGIPWHDSPTTHPPEVGVTPLAGCGAGMLWGQRATCSNKTSGVWQQGLWANAPAGATQVKCRALLLGYPR